MKRTLIKILGVVLAVTILFAACSSGLVGSASATSLKAGYGGFKVAVPAIAPWVLAGEGKGKSLSANAGRALCAADSVTFTVMQGSTQVTSWSESPYSSGNLTNGALASTQSQTIPAGSYTLSVNIYNDANSITVPIVAGTQNFSIASGVTTTVTVVCTPPSSNSLTIGTSLSADLGAPWVFTSGGWLTSHGAETWFNFTAASTNTLVSITPSSGSTDVPVFAVFDSTGNLIGVCGGQPATASIPTAAGAKYYIAVVDAGGTGLSGSNGTVAVTVSNIVSGGSHWYVAGEVSPLATNNDTFAVYWKDGALIYLPLSPNCSNAWASGITEDKEGNLYIVGGQWNNSLNGGNGASVYGYWKNSAFTVLPNGPYTDGNLWVPYIAVDTSGNVWVGGSDDSTYIYWKNGGSPAQLTGATGLSSAGADSLGNVYFIGGEGTTGSTWLPFYWENGGAPAEFPLGTYTNGWANSTALDASGNFYVGGQLWSATAITAPGYLKATNGSWGTPNPLQTGSFGSNKDWNLNGMAVDSSGGFDAYAVTGPTSSTTLVYWKGASSSPTALNLGAGNTYFSGSSGLCAVDALGNFYIVQSLGSSSPSTTPVYWVNGNSGGAPTSLPMGSSFGAANLYGQANGIVVGP
jgi:hypothetical protein